ncbi:MAG: nucleotide exchange factor GrpE [Armatimonadetes bacterium]|nr:nucleotide exchange factor GrpE [Armatimonadota bacterium]
MALISSQFDFDILMPDEQEKNQAAPRFRLPKLFAQGAEAAAEATLTEVEIAQSEADPETAKARPPASVASNGSPGAASDAALDPASEMAAMRQAIENLSEQVTHVNERETALERVFDALHAELADYKNDFLYEHLKPVVRPLLFLFDSLEQFDGEVAMAQATMTQAATESVLSPPIVQENLRFFRDQLIEALQVCEVTIMETPHGAFNAKFHKAIDVVPVKAPEDGTIVRVVRSGWFLNGQLLRPAEVVIGKFRG